LAALADKARDGKLAANWVINELFGRSTRKAGDIRPRRSPPSNSEHRRLIGEGTISGKIAKDCLRSSWQEGATRASWSSTRGMSRSPTSVRSKRWSTTSSAPIRTRSLRRKQAAACRWFVGQVMKSSGGKANPQAVNDLPEAKLGI